MKCPLCNQTNTLTWSKYLQSPTGRHVCESCHSHFSFRHSLKYYATITALWVAAGIIPSLLALLAGATQIQAFVIFAVLGFSVVIPADRKIDDTWRGTVLRQAPN